ncbi:MAG: hypothetical protein ABJA62_00780 [Luteimonas sp.]
MRSIVLSIVILGGSALLASCGHKDSNRAEDGSEAGESALPAPEATGGSITGMPDAPGSGQVAPVTGEPPVVAQSNDEPQVDLLNPETGMLPGDDDASATDNSDESASPTETRPMAEPTPQDAVAVIRDYYASIDARNFSRAYSLWSDSGRGSGQTPEQFANGFVDTVKVAVQTSAPGDADAAAGSRYITVPVAITATRHDGSAHRYDGVYTLRRTVVDGATSDQRAWRISSADLREIKP